MGKIYKDNNFQCLNCGLNLRCIVRVCLSGQPENMRQLLTDWTSKELEDNDVVSRNCFNILKKKLETNDYTREFGYRSVCLPCGASLLRAPRSIDVTDKQEKYILAQWIPVHQVKRLKRVCPACWARAHRATKKNNEKSIQEKLIKTEDPLAEDEVYIPVSLPEASEIKHEIEMDGNDNETERNKIETDFNRPISLPNYRRAAATRRICIFRCNNTSKSRLPYILKERLLIEHSFYVPKSAVICSKHLNEPHNEWDDLYQHSSCFSFNALQIEDMYSILKKSAERNYSNDAFLSLIRRNECICKYWLGVSYEEFQDKLNLMDPIRKILRFPKKCLAMYFMKRHTNYLDVKIASFFKVSKLFLIKNLETLNKFFETDVDFVNCEETVDKHVPFRIKDEKDSLL